MTAVTTPEYGHQHGPQFGQQGPQHVPDPNAPTGAPAPYGYPTNQFPQSPYPHSTPVTQPGIVPQQPEPENKGRKRGIVVGLVIALVLALGGGATWWVLSERASVASGASSPEEAAERLLTAVGNGDLLGAAQSLAPGEASVLGDQLQEAFTEFRRLGMLSQDADPAAFSGITFTAENLQFDPAAAERINDRVTVAKLTGGTFTLDADLTKLPLAPEYRDALVAAAQADGKPTAEKASVDVATLVKQTGSPIRIATVNVDGEWYPSLFYTVADLALGDAGMDWPSTSIPARGADSPTDAVRDLVQAALDADVQRVIELLPPDEMGVAHDVGPLLVQAAKLKGARPSGVRILDLQTENSDVTGGTLATITALEVDMQGQGRFSFSKNGDCYRVEMAGQSKQLCGADLAAAVVANADSGTSPETLERITGVLAAQGVGLVTTEVDGKHYVSPLRTVGDLGMRLYRELTPEDFKAMLEFN
ncbi:flagellar basal body protein FliL [Saccharomonospora sp. NB11]|uniref:flagellar basal body protein FliL n=1 Tax=Saccharomonospora sp. NB11 TaxID=1642298 RepID=UPI0018D14CDA|nr:flagellar basal body protein FliL [Saccharomonospora sp. NB11]